MGEKRGGLAVVDERYSVERVRAEAMAYLAERAAAPPPEPKPEPEPPTPTLPTYAGEGAVFLYIIASGGLVKIGYAGNLLLRVSNLRVDNPHGAELAFYCELPKPLAKHIELLAHAIFAAEHKTGEWFSITAGRAKSVVERIVAIATERCTDQ